MTSETECGLTVRSGRPYPLGASWDGDGTNFALYSEHGRHVWLCLFDEAEEIQRIELTSSTGFIWHVYVEGVSPGTRYGFRIDGEYAPERGHRFNKCKLLIDPYARALTGQVDWSQPVFDYELAVDTEELTPDQQDDAVGIPKSVVVDESFDWSGDRYPQRPLSETVIYEAHLKGMTVLREDVPPELRGTYLGLARPAVIDHLQRLGVTAVELLPIHAFVDDDFLVKRGFRQYWGYNSIGFFAPEARYRSSSDPAAEVREFKEMVKALHRAGIEVFLDVVYNHTAEAGALGPTLSFRGIDNATYYRLAGDDLTRYENLAGTGNSFNTAHPRALQLVLDSLRYWVSEMHVDGFRFDLAPVLGRDPVDFDVGAAFFDILRQDPILVKAGTKLIAEPWDLGHNGYQLGRFPEGWSEWNDKFRDTVRAFWLGHGAPLSELSRRIAGSSDVFDHDGRAATASVSFVTAHDGFTLNDLVSYAEKHNEDNGEENRDGHDHNLSANHGVEGPTDDPEIAALRARQRRNLLATVFISRGVPMFCAGDDVGHSQGGNNNAYCQDNEIGWIDWTSPSGAEDLGSFISDLAAMRAEQPALRRSAFRDRDDPERGNGEGLSWFNPSGQEMSIEDWENHDLRAMTIRIDSRHRDEADGDDMLIVLNGGIEAAEITLPGAYDAEDVNWRVRCSTDDRDVGQLKTAHSGELITVCDRSLFVFVRIRT